MKPLVERYAMLKNLRDNLLVETDKDLGDMPLILLNIGLRHNCYSNAN